MGKKEPVIKQTKKRYIIRKRKAYKKFYAFLESRIILLLENRPLGQYILAPRVLTPETLKLSSGRRSLYISRFIP